MWWSKGWRKDADTAWCQRTRDPIPRIPGDGCTCGGGDGPKVRRAGLQRHSSHCSAEEMEIQSPGKEHTGKDHKVGRAAEDEREYRCLVSTGPETEQTEAGKGCWYPCDYASSIVLVCKKSGALCPCVDYRRLKAKTRKNAYPLPRIDELLDALGRAHYFSATDLASAYNQAEVHPKD